MTRHEYERSIALDMADEPFYALIMAAMRRADTTNQRKLWSAFPDTWDELSERYNAPGGLLPSDQATPTPATTKD